MVEGALTWDGEILCLNGRVAQSALDNNRKKRAKPYEIVISFDQRSSY